MAAGGEWEMMKYSGDKMKEYDGKFRRDEGMKKVTDGKDIYESMYECGEEMLGESGGGVCKMGCSI